MSNLHTLVTDLRSLRLEIVLAAGVIALLTSLPSSAQTRPALVKDVDSPASQPFAASATPGFSGISANGTILTVPAGKRAVVEHFSCINFLDTGNNFVRLELGYTLDGATRRQQFVHDRVGTSLISGIDVWSFSQPVRLYADAGTAILVNALRRSGTGSGGIECHLSGHYVSVP